MSDTTKELGLSLEDGVVKIRRRDTGGVFWLARPPHRSSTECGGALSIGVARDGLYVTLSPIEGFSMRWNGERCQNSGESFEAEPDHCPGQMTFTWYPDGFRPPVFRNPRGIAPGTS